MGTQEEKWASLTFKKHMVMTYADEKTSKSSVKLNYQSEKTL